MNDILKDIAFWVFGLYAACLVALCEILGLTIEEDEE